MRRFRATHPEKWPLLFEWAVGRVQDADPERLLCWAAVARLLGVTIEWLRFVRREDRIDASYEDRLHRPRGRPRRVDLLPHPASDRHTWITALPETFSFEGETYDVTALKLRATREPLPALTLTLEPYRRLAERIMPEVPDGMEHDFKLPLLVVKHRIGLLPVDGWKRIRTGLLTGRTHLPSLRFDL